METQRITEFLNKFGKKVNENEEDWQVELLMDNHKVIEFEGQQYYICEDTSYGEAEEIYEYLIEHYLY